LKVRHAVDGLHSWTLHPWHLAWQKGVCHGRQLLTKLNRKKLDFLQVS